MCSIAGIINFPELAPAVARVGAMNNAQRHRGPDGSGVWHDNTACLGHRRLAIVDLDSGAQPMCNEDGTVHIVLNGEIYNYRELREELSAKGHTFRTKSDTESVIHLYEELGDKCFAKLEGMFALAIWDSVRGTLLLGRDRLGQKPLCYFRSGKSLIFASELAALRCHPDFSGELSAEAVSEYMSLLYIPPDKSVYSNVRKISPGTFMVYDAAAGSERSARYWSPDYRRQTSLNFADACAELRRLVFNAVEKRLMSDVPGGTFLSGGLDSAIITGAAATIRAGRGERTAAYTIGFDNKLYDERNAASLTASHLNKLCNGMLDCHVQTVDLSDFSLAGMLSGKFGEPYADSSMLPTYLLAKFAAADIKMALSGDGADEIFAGYERYLVMKYAAHLDMIPVALRAPMLKTAANFLPDSGDRTKSGRVKRLLNVLARRKDLRYFSIMDRCPEHLRHKLFGSRLRDELPNSPSRLFSTAHCTAKNIVERCMELDLQTYLPGDTLVKTDISSMAASLEVRNPFLDHNVVEFAISLPLDFKQHGKSRKHILKSAFADFLPPEIADARKRGFGVPVAAWLRTQWHDEAQELLFSGRLISDGWIDGNALSALWRDHDSKKADNSYILWGLLILAIFLNQNEGGTL